VPTASPRASDTVKSARLLKLGRVGRVEILAAAEIGYLAQEVARLVLADVEPDDVDFDLQALGEQLLHHRRRIVRVAGIRIAGLDAVGHQDHDLLAFDVGEVLAQARQGKPDGGLPLRVQPVDGADQAGAVELAERNHQLGVRAALRLRLPRIAVAVDAQTHLDPVGHAEDDRAHDLAGDVDLRGAAVVAAPHRPGGVEDQRHPARRGDAGDALTDLDHGQPALALRR
jgi:hypothetical protein